jgi:hypothetical protein
MVFNHHKPAKSFNFQHLENNLHSSLAGFSAVALLQDFVEENAAHGCKDWAPLIDSNAPALCITQLSHLHHGGSGAVGFGEEDGVNILNSSSCDLPFQSASDSRKLNISRSPSARSDAGSPSWRRNRLPDFSPPSHSANALKPEPKRPHKARLTSSEASAWGRHSEPRLKHVNAAPGPGSYSPKTVSTSSVTVKFGRSVNHKLPFRASYCEENLISHRAIPDETKLFGRTSSVSFTRQSRVLQLTASASDQAARATCSPFIGPGTYNIRSDTDISQSPEEKCSKGHVIPLGPRGVDFRSFRSNRVLKHTYEKDQNDAIIGVFTSLQLSLF